LYKPIFDIQRGGAWMGCGPAQPPHLLICKIRPVCECANRKSKYITNSSTNPQKCILNLQK